MTATCATFEEEMARLVRLSSQRNSLSPEDIAALDRDAERMAAIMMDMTIDEEETEDSDPEDQLEREELLYLSQIDVFCRRSPQG
jgi:hypothetical protein